jgi:hypothetical protein
MRERISGASYGGALIVLLDFLKIVPSLTTIRVGEVLCNLCVLSFKSLLFSFFRSILCSLNLYLVPVFDRFPLLLAFLCSRNPHEHSLFFQYFNGFSYLFVLILSFMKHLDLHLGLS